MYADCLRAEKFEVVEEDSAEAGLEHLLKGEGFDLVITDIMMAKMDGWELLDTIRKKLSLDDVKLPVIVISAFDSAELEAKAFHRGANGCLVKPISPLAKLLNMAKIQTGRVRSKYNEP
jgi:CheY-like chemotaxis protein